MPETCIIFAKWNRNHGDYFTLIYFGLRLINSLSASLILESFGAIPSPGCINPFFLSTFQVWLHFLRGCLVSPLLLQELLYGRTRIIFVLRLEDEKFLRIWLCFFSSPTPRKSEFIIPLSVVFTNPTTRHGRE